MKITELYVSPGHNFFGRHGKPAGEHKTNSVKQVECVMGRGLRGDRFWDYKREYAGQITFFDEAVHRRLLRALQPGARSPAAYRRNAITRGVDLNALIGQEFVVQGVRFLGVAESKPCYWMDQAVGVGAEEFLKGNGGLRARILSDGMLRVDCPTEAGLLLAGGRSRRMGRDKATIDLDGHSWGERQARTLAQSGAWPLLLSCRADQPWLPDGFVRVEDRETQGGVLGALADAWAATGSEVLTVLAIDVPKIRAEFLERMASGARDEAVSVVPWYDGRFEPLVAAWHRSAVEVLEQAKVTGAALQEVCATLQRDGRLLSFKPGVAEIDQLTNVNTPDDLVRLG